MVDEGSEQAPELRVSDAERQAVVERLRRASGEGRLSLSEFDDRVKAAYAAVTYSQLDPLTADLPPSDVIPVPAHQAASLSASRDEVAWTVAVMSGNERRGRWPMARRTTAVAFMGGCVLDLRDASLPPGEVTITAVAVMGGIQIYVPEGVDVHVSGLSLMGGRNVKVAHGAGSPGFPVVRIRAIAVMAGIEIKSKRPGSGKSLDRA
jgi:hypothetical protein